jgi:uncharacterized membrane protein YobD (UPF0266 family)
MCAIISLQRSILNCKRKKKRLTKFLDVCCVQIVLFYISFDVTHGIWFQSKGRYMANIMLKFVFVDYWETSSG